MELLSGASISRKYNGQFLTAQYLIYVFCDISMKLGEKVKFKHKISNVGRNILV